MRVIVHVLHASAVLYICCTCVVWCVQLPAEDGGERVQDGGRGGAEGNARARLVRGAQQVHRRRPARLPHLGLAARHSQGLAVTHLHPTHTPTHISPVVGKLLFYRPLFPPRGENYSTSV